MQAGHRSGTEHGDIDSLHRSSGVEMGEALAISLIKALELLGGAGVAHELMAGQEYRLDAYIEQAGRRLAAHHVHDHGAGDGGSGPGAPLEAFELEYAVAGRALVV